MKCQQTFCVFNRSNERIFFGNFKIIFIEIFLVFVTFLEKNELIRKLYLYYVYIYLQHH